MASSEPETPGTEAGRRLLRHVPEFAKDVSVIEAEAARSERERLRVAVERLTAPWNAEYKPSYVHGFNVATHRILDIIRDEP